MEDQTDMSLLGAYLNLSALRHYGKLKPLVDSHQPSNQLLEDDGVDINGAIGPNETTKLHERFLDRLANFLSTGHMENATVAVMMEMNAHTANASIFLAKGNAISSTAASNRQFVKEVAHLQNLFNEVGKAYQGGTIGGRAEEDLWQYVLLSYGLQIRKSIDTLSLTVREFQESFDEIIGDLSGVLDEQPSQLDYELQPSLITIHGMVECYRHNEGPDADVEDLVRKAVQLLRVDNFNIRMKTVCGSFFAEQMLTAISELAAARLTFDTILKEIRHHPEQFAKMKIWCRPKSSGALTLPIVPLSLQDTLASLSTSYNAGTVRAFVNVNMTLGEATKSFNRIQQETAPVHVEMQLLGLIIEHRFHELIPYIGRSNDCKLYAFPFLGLHRPFSTRGRRYKVAKSILFSNVRNGTKQSSTRSKLCAQRLFENLRRHLKSSIREVTFEDLISRQPLFEDWFSSMANDIQARPDKARTAFDKTSSPSNYSRDHPISRPTEPGDGGLVLVSRSLQRIRSYMKSNELDMNIRELQPVTRSQTFALAASILYGQVPSPATEIYYLFGFSTCENEDEAQILGGLWKGVFEDCDNKSARLDEMAKALEENTLIQLLDRCGWSDFRRQLPRLEVFLATDPIRRPSVYRLVQFLRTGSTNPIPCLGRDYGYKNCYNRDQVKRLNVVYSHILKDCSPQELHAECIQGTLRQFATEMGAKIEEKDLRLFETVARFSGGGYDDDRSSTSLNRGGLFRRSSG